MLLRKQDGFQLCVLRYIPFESSVFLLAPVLEAQMLLGFFHHSVLEQSTCRKPYQGVCYMEVCHMEEQGKGPLTLTRYRLHEFTYCTLFSPKRSQECFKVQITLRPELQCYIPCRKKILYPEKSPNIKENLKRA